MSGNRAVLLLVDDSPTRSATLAMRLGDEEQEVVAARSVAEALVLLEERPVDCVLIAEELAADGARQLGRRLDETSAWRDLPRVWVTAADDPATLIVGFDAGADECVARTADAALVRARLRALLRRRRARRAEVEEASRLKTQFMAEMSHELRTPLNAIIGFTEVLLDGKFGQPNERQARYLGNVLTSGRNLSSLINDLLDQSKIEAGRMEVSLQPCPPRMVAREVVLALQAAAEKKQVELIREAAEGPGQMVMADPVRLHQALYNILTNAIRVTPSGGRVHVRVAPTADHAAVRVTVAAGGPACTAEERLRLFNPLGLGLAKKLVELMRGRIGVDASAPEGLLLFIELPVGAA